MRNQLRHRLTLAGLLLTSLTSLNLGAHLVREGRLSALDLLTVFSGGIATGAAIALTMTRRRNRR